VVSRYNLPICFTDIPRGTFMIHFLHRLRAFSLLLSFLIVGCFVDVVDCCSSARDWAELSLKLRVAQIESHRSSLPAMDGLATSFYISRTKLALVIPVLLNHFSKLILRLLNHSELTSPPHLFYFQSWCTSMDVNLYCF